MKLERRIIEVNGKEYEVRAISASSQKTKYQDLGLNVTVRIVITNLTDNKIMPWKEIKGSYLQEKIEEHIKNCINLT